MSGNSSAVARALMPMASPANVPAVFVYLVSSGGPYPMTGGSNCKTSCFFVFLFLENLE